MADVLGFTDRLDRIVTLPERTWYDKILLDHHELSGNERAIERAVRDPDVHARDKEYANREVYYRHGALPPPDDGDYVKVVVVYEETPTGETRGRVVTAYAITRLARGEHILWTNPDRTSI